MLLDSTCSKILTRQDSDSTGFWLCRPAGQTFNLLDVFEVYMYMCSALFTTLECHLCTVLIFCSTCGELVYNVHHNQHRLLHITISTGCCGSVKSRLSTCDMSPHYR